MFLKWGFSIPLITSFAGITGRILLDYDEVVVIGILLCVISTNKIEAICGSLCFVIAYGFAAPTAPTVMSVSM